MGAMGNVEDFRGMVGKRYVLRTETKDGRVVEVEGVLGIESWRGKEWVTLTAADGEKVYLTDIRCDMVDG